MNLKVAVRWCVQNKANRCRPFSLQTQERCPFRRCQNVIGQIEIFKEYREGLKDIDGFSHIVVLWIFHESKGYKLVVEPLAYKGLRGVFATSHPDRPDRIGSTIVELLNRIKNKLRVKGIDMADGSLVVDIKPYGPGYVRKGFRRGWVETAERKY